MIDFFIKLKNLMHSNFNRLSRDYVSIFRLIFGVTYWRLFVYIFL